MFKNINPKYLPLLESFKEVARWGILLLVSYVITETMKQLNLVPETATLKIYVFSYVIPVRTSLSLGLTLLGRWADKLIHETGKATKNVFMTGGLTRF